MLPLLPVVVVVSADGAPFSAVPPVVMGVVAEAVLPFSSALLVVGAVSLFTLPVSVPRGATVVGTLTRRSLVVPGGSKCDADCERHNECCSLVEHSIQIYF